MNYYNVLFEIWFHYAGKIVRCVGKIYKGFTVKSSVLTTLPRIEKKWCFLSLMHVQACTMHTKETLHLKLTVILFLQRLYNSFKENQYPERATKESLAQELGLTFQQVRFLFCSKNENRSIFLVNSGYRFVFWFSLFFLSILIG